GKGGTYTFTLDGLSANLDLIVTKNADSLTCDPTSSCVTESVVTGTGTDTVSFTADPAFTYYIAVDGKNGVSSPYHIKLGSSACGAATCYDGFSSLDCSFPSSSGTNADSGSTSDVSSWNCAGVTGETGPEFEYLFTAPHTATYTVD